MGGFKWFLNFHPDIWGTFPIWRTYFSDGSVKNHQPAILFLEVSRAQPGSHLNFVVTNKATISTVFCGTIGRGQWCLIFVSLCREIFCKRKHGKTHYGVLVSIYIWYIMIWYVICIWCDRCLIAVNWGIFICRNGWSSKHQNNKVCPIIRDSILHPKSSNIFVYIYIRTGTKWQPFSGKPRIFAWFFLFLREIP